MSLYSKPYRDVGPDPWSKKTWQELKAEIVTHDLTQEAGIDYINVLLIGEIGRERGGGGGGDQRLVTVFIC